MAVEYDLTQRCSHPIVAKIHKSYVFRVNVAKYSLCSSLQDDVYIAVSLLSLRFEAPRRILAYFLRRGMPIKLEVVMEFRQLRSFCKIVEHGSFTRAAEALRITQPALGLQIRNLEEELRVPLLVRHSRGVELTPEGTILLERAQVILGNVDQAVRAVGDCRTLEKGEIRLGLAPSMAAMMAISLARKANEKLKQVRFEFLEAPTPILADWVSEKRVDIAIACEGPLDPNIIREELLHEWLYLVQKPIAGERLIGPPIEFRELSALPLAIADPMLTKLLYRKLVAAAETAGITLDIQNVLPSTDLVKTLVEDGHVATVMPYANVRRECQQGTLRVRKITGPTLTRNAYLLSHREASPNRAVRELIRLAVAEEIRDMPECATLSEFAL
jgi:LysR family nitrogen assimilation transcriptional regulator